MQLRVLPTAFLAVSLLAACETTTEPQIADGIRYSEWKSVAPPSYSYTAGFECFCLPEWTGPVQVVVQDGVVQSRTYVASGAPVDANKYWDRFAVVDSLFARLADARRSYPNDVRVEYDAQWGFPRRIRVNEKDMPVDGGYIITADNFTVR